MIARATSVAHRLLREVEFACFDGERDNDVRATRAVVELGRRRRAILSDLRQQLRQVLLAVA